MAEGTAVAVRGDGALPAQDFLAAGSMLYTTLDLVKDRQRVIALRMGQHEALDAHIGKDIVVEHVLAHPVTMDKTDASTGEVTSITAWRVVLVAPGGQAYQCVSNGVRDSIGVLSTFYGTPPWKPGLKLHVQQVKTRKGFRTFNLIPVAG